MAAKQPHPPSPSLAVHPDRPLIGVVSVENGQEVTHYFAEEAGTVGSAQTVADARALAGAWSDLNWEEMVEELDRIRHASRPAPPPSGPSVSQPC
jgi:hypothetical protein